jgi:hypothetical protein
MEFLLRGTVRDRINNPSREMKNGKGNFSIDYIVVDVTHIGAFFGKQIVSTLSVELFNKNKKAPFMGDIEVGDIVDLWCSIECELYGEYSKSSFTQKEGYIQTKPKLFPQVRLIEVKAHIKGAVAKNMTFDVFEAQKPSITDPDYKDDLPF